MSRAKGTPVGGPPYAKPEPESKKRRMLVPHSGAAVLICGAAAGLILLFGERLWRALRLLRRRRRADMPAPAG